MFLKKIFDFFASENMKKHPQKFLIIGQTFFFSTGPAAKLAQNQKSRTTKSFLMQD